MYAHLPLRGTAEKSLIQQNTHTRRSLAERPARRSATERKRKAEERDGRRIFVTARRHPLRSIIHAPSFSAVCPLRRRSEGRAREFHELVSLFYLLTHLLRQLLLSILPFSDS